jgi:hypothetical protein
MFHGSTVFISHFHPFSRYGSIPIQIRKGSNHLAGVCQVQGTGCSDPKLPDLGPLDPLLSAWLSNGSWTMERPEATGKPGHRTKNLDIPIESAGL